MEFFLVCIGTIKEVDQIFVRGEDQAFFESDCDLVKALVDFISVDYVFDVKYPQAFFTFCKRLYYCKVTVNTKEPSLPPLWQSLKRGALSKLLYGKLNLNTVNNESKGATRILHYYHLEKLSSPILENMHSFNIFNTFLSVHCFSPKEILLSCLFIFYFLVHRLK